MTANDTLIFQHIHAGSKCRRWIGLTLHRTRGYCRAHNMDYKLIMGNIGTLSPDGEFGHWICAELIREYLKLDYKYIIYLDADTIIADLTVDLRDACVPDKIGAVWHDLHYLTPDLSHFNVGALYISNTPLIREFVERWLAGYPGTRDFPWLDQGVFGIVGAEMGIINKLDNKWNAGHVSPSDHPVVLGLHGLRDRYATMKQKIEELNAKSS
jgi:hypothetical protein